MLNHPNIIKLIDVLFDENNCMCELTQKKWHSFLS